ncbi:M1 family metallopeptidase [Flavihumibacter petaseus]|uniref:Aminopeptidase N n=1 Tax=Flavihumibacter petaseus NBRC 106054 TaxID=1220578 RepID=A0A0E9N5Y5_9BACT|nr:M1 family metallopeptidase [Flavihumibacter petaseus]GAO44760.1 peptidase M1 family protein [Flavihumibacter petaseus NBRC 106054]
MKKGLYVSLLALAVSGAVIAQDEPVKPSPYRETPTRINNLVHTRLDVSFDYDKAWLNGKAWITLQPHFYPTDSLTLDAKGMDIKSVGLVNGSKTQPLTFKYDGSFLRIQLNKTYNRGENYIVYIDYTAKPNELKVAGSAAITDAKGLYFINPKGEEKNKPTQIWTQGETEATSVWCPTIDKPGQKCTEEISMTVPAKYVTLSNGKLVNQKNNSNGTRTDTWKMELPHSPYLFFMGVGDYAIIKDAYKGKEVSYYVEKEYAPVARTIFGNTPEMMAFYSRITGVEYPWVKYAQITGRDYVSGAMENTTATLHQESAQQDARELIDENRWEDVIAHELFHHWFGDYVTAESWSNLTLNESFADYSETLWNEYKYGKDAGAAANYSAMNGYLANPENASKDLARFHYNDKEDMFDAVSYQKGGRILNMLRNYLGDSAFFKGLNNYLTTNKFKAAEVHNLRLAFEEVSGRDLNWFFNQWYFGAGHPKLDIDYKFDDAAGKVSVIINQTQESSLFQLPVAVDIYEDGKKTRHNITITDKSDTFTFAYKKRPDLVNVDGDKVLLCEKKDNKTAEQFAYQYKNAGNYVDRREAIEYSAAHQDVAVAQTLLVSALKDPYFGLRILTLGKLDMKNSAIKAAAEKTVTEMAAKDPKALVRAKAIEVLARYENAANKGIFEKGVKDSSYSIAGASLEALAAVDNEAAVAATKAMLGQPAKGGLLAAITAVAAKNGIEEALPTISQTFGSMGLSQSKFEMLQPLSMLIAKTKNSEQVKKGIDLIVEFRESIPAAYRNQTDAYINTMVLQGIENAKKKENTPESLQLVEYIKSKKEADKKAF